MTKRENELIEEVEALKKKLSNAEIWMQRQVRESSEEGRHFFERRKKDMRFQGIQDLFEKIKGFITFRRKPTVVDLWKSRLEAFLVGSAIILFWRGVWNLADIYLLPSHPTISGLISLFIGVGILILSRNFVNQFIDDAVEEAEEFE